jgi:hypothetical protein
VKHYACAGVVALMLLPGCEEPSATGPLRSKDSSAEHEYSCGGPRDAFTARDVEEGPEPSDDLRDALERLRASGEGRLLPADGWTVVSEDGNTATLLAPAGKKFASATFERRDGWSPAGWGDCTPRLVAEDRSVLRWAFTEDSHPPDEDATELDVLAVEPACSSGRDLEGLIEERIAYEETTIEVALTAPALAGGANVVYTCIGTSPTPYTVELDEPVGERKVVDVSVYPPVEPEPGTPLP